MKELIDKNFRKVVEEFYDMYVELLENIFEKEPVPNLLIAMIIDINRVWNSKYPEFEDSFIKYVKVELLNLDLPEEYAVPIKKFL